MKWLPSLLLGLTCFAFGVVFAYWIQGQLLYESIKNFVITGTSFALVVGLTVEGGQMFREWHKGKKDEKEKAMADLRKHTDDLVPILKKWAEQPQEPPNEYLLPFVQQHMSGDEQVRNILGETDGMDNTKSQCDELQKKIPRYIRDVIGKQAFENFPELQSEEINALVDEIRLFHENQYLKERSYTFVATFDSSIPLNKYALQSRKSDGSVRSTYLMGDKKNVQTLAEIMNNLLADSHLQEMTKTLLTLADRLYKLQNTFKQRIDSIINEITYAITEQDKILRGKCTKCEDAKNKWNIN
jgi:ElaB/YqjD/DUF883 family membrane-anchored ribosome-binding protein